MYLCVSTEYQTEYSPASQLKLINAYAEKNGFAVTRIYSDEGISGRKAEKRPAFKEMLQDAKNGAFETILIYNTSRFARNHEESIVYRNMLKREGIDVVSITQPSVDYKTDMLMNALYAVMDERYSIELSENVKRGMKEKVSRGEYISCAPYGYERKERNKPLSIHETEGPIVRWIFESYLEGCTMFAIAGTLNAQGVLSKRGNSFDRRAVRRILTNVTYKGYLKWNCDGIATIVPADHPPLVDAALFDKVQVKLLENNSLTPSPLREPGTSCKHWLKGVIRCQQCGSTYVLVKGYNGRDNAYRCGKGLNASCKNTRSISVGKLEEALFKELAGLAGDLYICRPHKKTTGNPPRSGRDTLRETKSLQKRLARAKQAYLSGIDSLAEYKENKSAVETALAQLAAAKNPPPSNEVKAPPAGPFTLTGFLSSPADMDSKNIVASALIHHIAIDHDNRRIALHLNPSPQ